MTLRVVIFHKRQSSHVSYTSQVISQSPTRVKLNSVFFPRWVFPSPFPWLWFRQIVDWDSGDLVNPFLRVSD